MSKNGQLCPGLEDAEEACHESPISQATDTHILMSFQGQGSPLKAARYQRPPCLLWAKERACH